MIWLALLACSKDAQQPALEGSWLAGDLHVHSSVGSNDTDGLGTFDALPGAMARAGLDFLVLSDHSNATGSMHCDDVEDCPNLGPESTGGWPESVWMGNEISPIFTLDGGGPPTGHVGCVAPERTGFPGLDHFVDRPPGAVTGGDAVEQCKAAGGWAIVNHPFGPASWVAYDWTSDAFDALEVYNGGARFDGADGLAVDEWERRWAAGQEVVAVGGSDCHRWGTEPPGDPLNPPLGWPITWVRLLDGETIVDGLRAGRVVVAEPGTELTVTARGEGTVAGPGDRIDGPVVLTVQASAVASGLRLEIRTVQGEEIDSVALSGSAELELEVEAGQVYARVWPEGEEVGGNRAGVALSKPDHRALS